MQIFLHLTTMDFYSKNKPLGSEERIPITLYILPMTYVKHRRKFIKKTN